MATALSWVAAGALTAPNAEVIAGFRAGVVERRTRSARGSTERNRLPAGMTSSGAMFMLALACDDWFRARSRSRWSAASAVIVGRLHAASDESTMVAKKGSCRRNMSPRWIHTGRGNRDDFDWYPSIPKSSHPLAWRA